MGTVLVVDDDPLFRSVMKHHLERLGFEVIENDSGVGVAEQLAEYRPVACLIDILMDRKEGLETILEVAEKNGEAKIIAVSVNSTYLPIAAEFGAAALLVKPVSGDALADALQKIGIPVV